MRTRIKRRYKCYIMTCGNFHSLKIPEGPLSGLRQFLTTESPLKVMKNVFYVKALFVLEIFALLS